MARWAQVLGGLCGTGSGWGWSYNSLTDAVGPEPLVFPRAHKHNLSNPNADRVWTRHRYSTWYPSHTRHPRRNDSSADCGEHLMERQNSENDLRGLRVWRAWRESLRSCWEGQGTREEVTACYQGNKFRHDAFKPKRLFSPQYLEMFTAMESIFEPSPSHLHWSRGSCCPTPLSRPVCQLSRESHLNKLSR